MPFKMIQNIHNLNFCDFIDITKNVNLIKVR